MHRIKRGLSPALIVAIAAAAFAVAGGASAVTSSEQASPAKVTKAAKSLRGPRGPRGKTGKVGPQGPQGLQGNPGPQGAPGIARIVTVESAPVNTPPGEVRSADASCPAGMTVVGTGANVSIANFGFGQKFGTFVRVAAYNDTSISVDINAQAICAELPPGVSLYGKVDPEAAKRQADKALAEFTASIG